MQTKTPHRVENRDRDNAVEVMLIKSDTVWAQMRARVKSANMHGRNSAGQLNVCREQQQSADVGWLRTRSSFRRDEQIGNQVDFTGHYRTRSLYTCVTGTGTITTRGLCNGNHCSLNVGHQTPHPCAACPTCQN